MRHSVSTICSLLISVASMRHERRKKYWRRLITYLMRDEAIVEVPEQLYIVRTIPVRTDVLC